MKFQTAYSEKIRFTTINNEASLTKQSLADAANINNIVKRYNKTGVLPNLAKLEATYGQITSASLQDSLQQVMDAKEAFNEIPSAIRAQFNQNAGSFIDYATNPDNIDQMVKWGLAEHPLTLEELTIAPTIAPTPDIIPDPQPQPVTVTT